MKRENYDRIVLILEPVQELSIDKEQILDFQLHSIKGESDRTKMLSLHFSPEFSKESIHRLQKYPDICSVVVHKGENSERYVVEWTEEEDPQMINPYQKSYLDNESGEFYVVVSKEYNLEDIYPIKS